MSREVIGPFRANKARATEEMGRKQDEKLGLYTDQKAEE
jgi:hypothetical protein